MSRNEQQGTLDKWSELVHVYRGTIGGESALEVTHRGAISIVDGDGMVVVSWGDTENSTHLRSTAKPFQALPFVMRNLKTEFGIDDAELALFVGSHGGEKQHIDRLVSAMHKLGIDPSELLCGVHPPTYSPARTALFQAGEKPTVLHNNCSGKHCAMIAVSKKEAWPMQSYIDEGHPLQTEIAELLLEVSGRKAFELGVGVDGCSAATFILPLSAIAQIYARLSFPKGLRKEVAESLLKIFEAATQNAEMVAGTKRLDSLLMQTCDGIFAKTGADGVYAISIQPREKYPQGLGIAIKIADGDPTHRARDIVVLKLLLDLEIVSLETLTGNEQLSSILEGKIRNWRGLVVGQVKAVF